ncbi:hypothetical protein NDU88_000615 [Pleurodeles waltl]|uniref:Uncharacterized protein n=1 Tax=Pleurodeles waltl TaxID=8319 RepID=A0AAV7U5G9_PLEWA|nr:hypothetical protein NDU88_000615 [Pleurodeles waltl]
MCGALLLPVSEILEAVSDPDVCMCSERSVLKEFLQQRVAVATARSLSTAACSWFGRVRSGPPRRLVLGSSSACPPLSGSVGRWACTRHSRVQPVERRKEQRANCPYSDYAKRRCPAVRAPPFPQPQCTYRLIAVSVFTAVCAPFDNLKASGAADRSRLGQPHVLWHPSGALRSVLSVETGCGDVVKSPAAGSAHEDQQPRESGSHFHPLSLRPHSTCENRHVVSRHHGNRWFSPRK